MMPSFQKPKAPTKMKTFEEEKTSRQRLFGNLGRDAFFFFQNLHLIACFWF